jgi:hypothetical protein
MKIEIDYNSQTKIYTAKIYDGPDGLDDAIFNCTSLGECFEKLLEFRLMNALTYSEDVKESIRAYFG